MTLRTQIQTALRKVVSSTTGFGEVWQYRRRTNGMSAVPATFGSWTDFDAHASARGNAAEHDGDKMVWKRTEHQVIRTSDALSDLHQGDQVKDPASVIYAIGGIQSSGVGTIAYAIDRIIPLKAEPNRQGGVS